MKPNTVVRTNENCKAILTKYRELQDDFKINIKDISSSTIGIQICVDSYVRTKVDLTPVIMPGDREYRRLQIVGELMQSQFGELMPELRNMTLTMVDQRAFGSRIQRQYSFQLE